MIRVINANIITPHRIIRNGCISMENGKITAAKSGNDDYTTEDGCIDASGCYLALGFIDLHTHGGGGHDFMDWSRSTARLSCTPAMALPRYSPQWLLAAMKG